MRSLAAVAFIGGIAAIALWLGFKPTVADGRVMEEALLALIKAQGVIGVVCDAKVPIGRRGARFRCTATLTGGQMQALDCELDREGRLSAKPASGVLPADGASEPGAPAPEDVTPDVPPRAIPSARDPWGPGP